MKIFHPRVIATIYFLINSSVFAMYVLSIAKGSWFYDVQAKNDKQFVITDFGLWITCYTINNSYHDCDSSQKTLQWKLQDGNTVSPYWIGVMQLTSVLGIMFFLFSLIVALKSICDKKVFDSGEIKLIFAGTCFMIFTHSYITYRLIILDIHPKKWGMSFILNIAGIVFSLIRLVLPVLYAHYVNPKDQANCAKIYYDELGSTSFRGAVE